MNNNFTILKHKIAYLFYSSFLILPTISFAQDYQREISSYISSIKKNEFKREGLKEFEIDNIDSSKSLKGDIVKIQQKLNGIPIYNSLGTVVFKNKEIIYYSDSFLKDYRSVNSEIPRLSDRESLKKVALDLRNIEISNYKISTNNLSDKDEVIKKLVYVEENNNLKLAYEFSFKDPKSKSYWNILVDADSGEIILKNDLNLSCKFHLEAYKSDFTHHECILDYQQYNIKSTLADNAQYNVFPLPIESPNFGSRSVVSNPWISSSSPEGWHSTGTSNYTITRGNNVYAYEDSNNKNEPGFSPDGGATRNFDFPFSLNSTPQANRSAAITNLFYVNNRVHDIFYKFGFTESARNFQENNFGKGGLGNDFVIAEAQDGGDLNNADFTTPVDGRNPVMQMYLWSTVNRYFFYNSPSSAISRIPQASTAQFGPALNGVGVTADISLASVIDGCTTLTPNSLVGKIGLVERGGGSNCTFALKVKNAQDAGAVAAIIYNNQTATNFPSSMGGTDASITIPSVLISYTEGEFIKSQLANSTTVNVTLKSDPTTAVTPDGSFDNGIITHEYSHGVSNRLTGNGYSCLLKSASSEQMGEGWSDFFALILTNKPTDNANIPRSIGTYASGQAASGLGFRPAKYSPDFSINNFTYVSTNGMEIEQDGEIVPDVHSIGFVWASMLWDLHWKYVEKYGYSADVTSDINSGSARVLQLVTDALKLQNCNPTFIDGRNAILTAEMLSTKGEDRCMIWKTFAKRGLGLNALSGDKKNIHDQVEDFSVPKDCIDGNSDVIIDKSLIKIYPNPAKDEFYIYLKDFTIGNLHLQIYDMTGKLLLSENRSSQDSRIPVTTKNFENGIFIVKIQGIGIDATTKLIIKK